MVSLSATRTGPQRRGLLIEARACCTGRYKFWYRTEHPQHSVADRESFHRLHVLKLMMVLVWLSRRCSPASARALSLSCGEKLIVHVINDGDDVAQHRDRKAAAKRNQPRDFAQYVFVVESRSRVVVEVVFSPQETY